MAGMESGGDMSSAPTPTASLSSAPSEGGTSLRVELHIPPRTFFKIFAAVVLAYAIWILWPLLLLGFLALFLAVTLHAAVGKLQARGLSLRVARFVVVGSLLTLLGIGLSLIIPALLSQVSAFGENLPRLREAALHQLPVGDSLRQSLTRVLESPHWSESGAWPGHLWSAGGIALGGVSQLVLLLVIALYLLMDGHKVGDWLLAFFAPLQRSKLRSTAKEISKVIFGYVSGQIITSALVMVYTYTILTLLHVPAALMLAILAGFLDILPIIGFFLAAAPAFLLALSVSPQTGYATLGLYLFFHAVEAYIIIPRVYGRSLRMSTLTVLLGLLAGTLLAGIPGALAALPVIASYTAIERIWLKPFLRAGVSEKHEQQKDEEFGDKL